MKILKSSSLVLRAVSLKLNRSTMKVVVCLKEMQNINQHKLCVYMVSFIILHTANKNGL